MEFFLFFLVLALFLTQQGEITKLKKRLAALEMQAPQAAGR